MTQPHSRAYTRRRPQITTVIVVGGGPALTEFIHRSLGQHEEQPEVITTMLPSELMQQLRRRNVPLVVCDDSAPCLRSFQMLGEIKARSPHSRVALIVPGGSAEQEQRARLAGADEYLPQAFALKRLRTIIDELFA